MKSLSFPTVAGRLLILGGIGVMLAWWTYPSLLTQLSPNGVAMVFNTGFSFFLSGVALALTATGNRSTSGLRTLLGCVMALLASLVLAEDLFSLDLGIDWFELHRRLADKNPHPGRMAPNTALAFLLTAFTLIPRATRARASSDFLAQMLPAAVLALGVTGLADNALHLDMEYAWFGVTRMSMPTGIGITLLGSALWVDQRRILHAARLGPSPGEGHLYGLLGLALTLLFAIAAISYGSIHALEDRARWVARTFEVRQQFGELLAEYRRVRIAHRSYLIDGAETNLRDFETALAALPSHLQAARQLIADPNQQARFDDIKRLLDLDLATASADVLAKRDGKFARAEDALAQMAGGRFNLAELNRMGRAFDDAEARLLEIRERESQASVRTTTVALVVGNTAGFAILLLCFWALKRQHDRRARAEEALQRANHELESRVEQRTGDLARANADLAALNTTLEHRVDERTAELVDLYNNAPCGYHSVDQNGVFVRMNDTELGWLGYCRDEVIGKMRHHDLHTAESLERYLVTFAQFKENGVLQDVEFEYVRKDGSKLPVALNATAIRDPDGNYVMSRTTLYDITKRKQAEREIEELNADLQQRAVQLEATNKELEGFSYSVSHDLRAPVRAIDGYALMLEEDYAAGLDAEAKRFLSVIRSNSRRMGTLIDDLLAFSRLGRQAIAKNPLNMDKLVEEVIAETRQGESVPNATIEAGALPPAHADRALLRQVWVNLISNALKYSSGSTAPVIRVSGHRNGTENVYSVSDNGVGFDMAYYHKLFGVFQRLHRAEEFSGTGVGLAIVQRVVTRHGGRVWAEGKINAGATFSFALPAGEGNE